MGRPANDYKIVVRPWEASIDHASHTAFSQSDNSNNLQLTTSVFPIRQVQK